MKGSRGFSLAELLIVVLLSAILLSGLSAIFFTGIRFQVDGLRRSVVQNSALSALKALQAQLNQATYLSAPALGAAPSGIVAGGINVRPDTFGPLAPGAQRYFYFCTALTAAACGGQTAPCLWYYSANVWPPPAITCGTTGGGLFLAARLTSGSIFSRNYPNVVHAALTVLQPGDAVIGQDIQSSFNVDLRTRMADN